MSKNYRSDDTTALVGMPELVVRAQLFRDGEWWLNVETSTAVVWCHRCGCRAVGHGRTRTQVRDLPIAGLPTVLVFGRRRWRCVEPLCAVTTWSEHVDAIAARASLSERARRRLAEMVNIDGDSIAAAAVEFGVGWHTAHAAVIDEGSDEVRRGILNSERCSAGLDTIEQPPEQALRHRSVPETVRVRF